MAGVDTSDETLRAILSETRTIALVGASPNPARPSNGVMRFLLGRGYHVIPVNPGHAGGEIAGQRVYATLSDIPEPIDMVDIFRRAEAVGPVVDEALTLDPLPKTIWMQLGIVNEAAAERAAGAGLRVVMDRCPAIEYPRLMGTAAL